MKYGSVFLAFFAITTLEAAKGMLCPVKFHRVGCSGDKVNDRALPNELINERDPINHHFNGILIDWKNFNTYLPAFACRCAVAAIAKGNNIFGLQFYAECWSGPSPAANQDFDKHGNTSRCEDSSYRQCGKSDICVGEASTNFIYELETPCDSSPCKNGGSCSFINNSFSCQCPPDFGGDTCKVPKCTGSKKLDLLYIISGSDKVTQINFNRVKDFLMNLNDRFQIGADKTRVAVEEFAGNKKAEIFVNLNKKERNNEVRKLNKFIKGSVGYFNQPGADTGNALEIARKKVFTSKGGDRKDAKNVLILFAFGKATDGNKQIEEANKIRDSGVTIIGIVIGERRAVSRYQGELFAMASKSTKSESKLVFQAKPDELDKITTKVAEGACN